MPQRPSGRMNSLDRSVRGTDPPAGTGAGEPGEELGGE